jgi:hypothetical protein
VTLAHAYEIVGMAHEVTERVLLLHPGTRVGHLDLAGFFSWNRRCAKRDCCRAATQHHAWKVERPDLLAAQQAGFGDGEFVVRQRLDLREALSCLSCVAIGARLSCCGMHP